MRIVLSLFFSICLANLITAQTAPASAAGYRIEIDVEGYDGENLRLANNLLDNQFLVDTAVANEEGSYVFSGDEPLPIGVYLVVTQPNNDYFQLLVAEDQRFSVKTDTTDLAKLEVRGDRDNEVFAQYLAFLAKQRNSAAPLTAQLQDSTLTEKKRDAISAKLSKKDEEVAEYQRRLVDKNAGTFAAAIVKANMSHDVPEFADVEDDDERRDRQWRWLQKNYLSNVDLSDERLLRTPFLFEKLNYYVDRLVVQHPDTIGAAIDGILERMDPSGELFKYYVVHFVNKAAKASSKIVGMDALYVRLIDDYYKTGKAYWADEEQVGKMTAEADRIRPLLIGKQAPDLQMKRRDGTPVSLYEIDARYTILYFWQFACGSCKKSTPHMKQFYEKWKDEGVEIFAVCTKQKEIDQCWEYIDDNAIDDWLHATDRYLRFARDYDVRSTPSIFILDENKEIVSKKIGAEQLDELLTALEKQRGDADSASKSGR